MSKQNITNQNKAVQKSTPDNSKLDYYQVQGRSQIIELEKNLEYKKSSLFHQLQSKVRSHLFKINHLLLSHQPFGSLTYQGLLLLEFIQTLFFILQGHKSFNDFSVSFQKAPSYLNQTTPRTTYLNASNLNGTASSQPMITFFYLDHYIAYFNFQVVVLQTNSFLSYTLLYSLMSAIFLLLIILGIIFADRLYRSSRQQELKEGSKIMLKLVSGIFALFLFVFQLPMLTIYLQGFKCNEDSSIEYTVSFYECYSSSHIALIITSSLMLLLYFTFIGIQSLLFSSCNFDSKVPWSSLQNKSTFLKILLKILLAAEFVFDKSGSLKGEITLVAFFLQGGIIFNTMSQGILIHRVVYLCTAAYELIQLWFFLLVGIHNLLGKETSILNLVQILGLGILSSMSLSILFSFRQENYLLKPPKTFLSSPFQYQLYSLWVFKLISSFKPRDQILLQGILTCHLQECSSGVKCNCSSINESLDKITFSHYKKKLKNIRKGEYIQSSFQNNSIAQSQLNLEEISVAVEMKSQFSQVEKKEKVSKSKDAKKYWYQYLALVLEHAIAYFPKNCQLKIIDAFIQKAKINNEFKAMFGLMNCELCSPTLAEQFSIFSLKIQIENVLQLKHQKNIQDIGKLDVVSIYRFEKHLEQYMELEFIITKASIEFWKSLQSKVIDIDTLRSKGSEVSNNYSLIRDVASQIQAIYPYEIKFLFKYGSFLKEIVNNRYEALLYLEKAYHIYHMKISRRNFNANEMGSFGENSGTAIIIIEATSMSIGNIVHANEDIKRVLGYNRKDVIGKNVSSLMPRSISKVHNKFIERYFQTAKPTVIDCKRELFGITSEGYLQPIVLLVKVYPQLMKKLLFVGFIQSQNKFDDMEQAKQEFESFDHNYLMADMEGNIFNVTQGLNEEIGLSSKFFNYSDSIFQTMFSFSRICQEIQQPSLQDEMENEGVILRIDTTNMLNHIELEKLNSEEILEVRSKIGYYIVYIQLKNLVLDASFCCLKLYRIVVLGATSEIKLSEYDLNQFMIQKFDSEQNFNQSKVEVEANSMDSREDSTAHQMSISSASSGSSRSTQYNRVLSDFKRILNDKAAPRSLNILDRLVSLILLMFLILSIVEFAFSYRWMRKVIDLKQLDTNLQMRASEVVQLSAFIRSLTDIANGLESDTYYINSNQTANFSRFDYIRRQIVSKVDDLAKLNTQISQIHFKYQTILSDSDDSILVSLNKINPNGTVYIESSNTNLALQLFVDSALALNQSKISSFRVQNIIINALNYTVNNSSTQNSIFSLQERDIYFLLANGFREIRQILLKEQPIHFAITQKIIQSSDNQFLITAVIGIAMTISAIIYVICKIHSIEKHKACILQFFASIKMSSLDQINQNLREYLNLVSGLDVDEKGISKSGTQNFLSQESLARNQLNENLISEEEKEQKVYKNFVDKFQGRKSRLNAKENVKGLSHEEKYFGTIKKAVATIKSIQEIENQRSQPKKILRHSLSMSSVIQLEIPKQTKVTKKVSKKRVREESESENENDQRDKQPKINSNSPNKNEDAESGAYEEIKEWTELEVIDRQASLSRNITWQNINQILIISTIAMIFSFYLIWEYIQPLILSKNIEESSQIAQAMTNRQLYITLAFSFLRERILTDNILLYEAPDIDAFYYNLSLANENLISEYKVEHSQFSQPLIDYLKNIDYLNFCQTTQFSAQSLAAENDSISLAWMEMNQQILQTCSNISNGIFNSGFQQVLGVFQKQFTDVLLQMQFQKNNPSSMQSLGSKYISKNSFSNSNSAIAQLFELFYLAQENLFNQITDYEINLLKNLNQDAFISYESEMRIMFGVVAALIVFIFLFLKKRLIMRMHEKIISSKGVMNLIPEELIEANQESISSLVKRLKD